MSTASERVASPKTVKAKPATSSPKESPFFHLIVPASALKETSTLIRSARSSLLRSRPGPAKSTPPRPAIQCHARGGIAALSHFLIMRETTNTSSVLPPSCSGETGNNLAHTSVPTVQSSVVYERTLQENQVNLLDPVDYLTLSPLQLIESVGILADDEAAHVLQIVLTQHGFAADALKLIEPSCPIRISWEMPPLRYWLERFGAAATHIDGFSFTDWARLALLWRNVLEAAEEADYDSILEAVRGKNCRWSSPATARRARAWMLGNTWHFLAIDGLDDIADVLAGWLLDFRAQCEEERSVLRLLFHDAQEIAEFDALPEEFFVYHSAGMNPLTAGLEIEDVMESAMIAQYSLAVKDPTDPRLDKPHAEARLVLKSLVVGVKKICSPREEFMNICAVIPPWSQGRLLHNLSQWGNSTSPTA